MSAYGRQSLSLAQKKHLRQINKTIHTNLTREKMNN